MDEKERSFNWLHKSQEKYGFVYRGKTIGEDFRMKELKEEKEKQRLPDGADTLFLSHTP